MTKSYPFDSDKYNFVVVVNSLFEGTPLFDLHTLVNGEYKDQFQVGMDSSTIFHKQFYDKYHSGWHEMSELYERFIKEYMSSFFDEDFLYQKFPTFRVHLPNNVAVGAFHSDASFGHPEGEINYIIPLTNSKDTASVWVESRQGKNDFKAMELTVGNLVEFNGNILTHGNKKNETSETRVSMDFRILPISYYDENNNSESITLHTKFKEGEYYKRFKK